METNHTTTERNLARAAATEFYDGIYDCYATAPATCGWLIEVASGNPEPDCYADTIAVIECGEPVSNGRHALCAHHQFAMDLPEDEFDRISEAHDGRAWS